jgi:hypothetical protein
VSQVTKFEIEEARKLNSVLHIVDVKLHQLDARHMAAGILPVERFAYASQIGTVLWARRVDDVIGFYRVKVTIQQSKQPSSELIDLAKFEVTHRLIYHAARPLGEQDEEQIPHFLAFSGWMHVWPFVRYEIQTLTTKLGFPPVTLPLALAGMFLEIPVERILEPKEDAQSSSFSASSHPPRSTP